jgi:putative DNA primase/helicase
MQGCSNQDIIQALQDRRLWRKWQKPVDRDEIREEEEEEEQDTRIEAIYSYRFASRQLMYQILRYGKDGKLPFVGRQPKVEAADGWGWNLTGIIPLPYRLPEMRAVPLNWPIYIVEGEKDANNLAALGFHTSTSHGGCGQAGTIWPQIAHWFKNRHVVILPDNDTAGDKYASVVHAALYGVAKDIKRIDLPGLPDKGDVSDWIAAGGTADQLRELTAVAVEWQPDTDNGEERLMALRGTDMVMEPIRWAWPNVIAYGKLMLIAGDPKWASLPLPLVCWRRSPPRGSGLMAASVEIVGMSLSCQPRMTPPIRLYPGLLVWEGTAAG